MCRGGQGSNARPASQPTALRSVLILAGTAVKSTLGGAVVGAIIGGLILAVGVTAAAWIASALAGVAIVVGAIDWVRTHG